MFLSFFINLIRSIWCMLCMNLHAFFYTVSMPVVCISLKMYEWFVSIPPPYSTKNFHWTLITQTKSRFASRTKQINAVDTNYIRFVMIRLNTHFAEQLSEIYYPMEYDLQFSRYVFDDHRVALKKLCCQISRTAKWWRWRACLTTSILLLLFLFSLLSSSERREVAHWMGNN